MDERREAVTTMAPEIFTGEWARDWCEEINRSEAYAEAAESWEGALVLAVHADPSYGLEEGRAVWVDLWHGECREARAAGEGDREEAPYVIAADPYSWKRVLEGEMDPISGLMRGKLKLERGSVVELARYVRAAKELVAAAGRVESRYPEGWE